MSPSAPGLVWVGVWVSIRKILPIADKTYPDTKATLAMRGGDVKNAEDALKKWSRSRGLAIGENNWEKLLT